MILPALLTAVALLITILTGAAVREETGVIVPETEAGPWTLEQMVYHAFCDGLRAAGVSEDDQRIKDMQDKWWAIENQKREAAGLQRTDVPTEAPEMPQEAIEEPAVSQDTQAQETPIWDAVGISWEDYCTMCCAVQHEAGPGCTPEHQRDMAAVVWNRVKSPSFPDTVVEVISQPRQYSSSYVTDSLDGVDQSCIDAVDAVISGEWTIPADCVWQANFVQGRYIYATHEVNTGHFYSITYICGG